MSLHWIQGVRRSLTEIIIEQISCSFEKIHVCCLTFSNIHKPASNIMSKGSRQLHVCVRVNICIKWLFTIYLFCHLLVWCILGVCCCGVYVRVSVCVISLTTWGPGCPRPGTLWTWLGEVPRLLLQALCEASELGGCGAALSYVRRTPGISDESRGAEFHQRYTITSEDIVIWRYALRHKVYHLHSFNYTLEISHYIYELYSCNVKGCYQLQSDRWISSLYLARHQTDFNYCTF